MAWSSAEEHRLYRVRHPERISAYRERASAGMYRRRLRQKYGMGEVDYARMFEEQEGKCALCYRLLALDKSRASVDHSHKTGKVRGLLHRKCNLLLGLLGDDAMYARLVTAYLDKHMAITGV